MLPSKFEFRDLFPDFRASISLCVPSNVQFIKIFAGIAGVFMLKVRADSQSEAEEICSLRTISDHGHRLQEWLAII